MSDNTMDTTEAPTRRDTIKYGGTVVGGGLLAGCTGDADSNATPETTETSSTEDGTESQDSSYTVTMEPVGTVEFESVPERWAAYDGGYADIGVALGVGDGLETVGNAARFDTTYYEQIDGIGIDKGSLTNLLEADMGKEVFYEVDADLHVMDPNMLVHWFEWDESDVEEVTDEIGPFFGNLIFRQSDDWHDYRYYDLYEAFERVAAVFQRMDRFEAWQSFHDQFIADLQSRLPPENERPEMMLLGTAPEPPTEFSPYHLDAGTQKKQWHDLKLKDAFEGTDVEPWGAARAKIDYETMLEIDPDMIVIGHEPKTRAEFEDRVVSYMEDDPVASQLTAVQNDRVYRGGLLYQGPLQNLFMTERAAKQAYPDDFGDIDSDEQLFDRQRVADIINGEI